VPRRGQKGKPRALPGDPTDPEGLTAWMLRYLESLEIRSYSPHTLRGHRNALDFFIAWAHERDLKRPSEITRPILLRYQRWLFHYRKKNGKPLTVGSQHARLSSLRGFFRWLTRQNGILSNPAADLELPRKSKRLPRHVLTPGEAEQVLAIPDVSDPLGLRDRAILETLYSTGIRRMEVVALKLYDLDRERGTLLVRQGKGRKDRTVPIGERALAWCDKYLREVRPHLSYEPDEGYLFLTKDGEGFSTIRMSHLAAHYVDQANLGKTGGCHLWRHSVATAMLENGADLRYIQEMLGHANLRTTEIYTRVSIRKLKEIHTATHPSAQLRRRRHGGELLEDATGSAELELAGEDLDDEVLEELAEEHEDLAGE